MSTTLVMYHHACADGSMAAAVTALAHSSDTNHFMPLQYAKEDGEICDAEKRPLHLIKELFDYDKIVVVDFSLRENQMAAFCKQYKGDFIVLDHHNVRTVEKYKEECAAINAPPFLDSVIFDAAGSGTLLAYMKQLTRFQNVNYTYLGNLIKVSQLVSDRDTWRRENKRAFAFYEGYAQQVFANVEEPGKLYTDMPPTVWESYKVLTTGDIEQIIDTGFMRIVERDLEIQSILDERAVFSNGTALFNFDHVVCRVSRALTSETGQYVFDNYPKFPIAILVKTNKSSPDLVFVSVRSSPHSAISAKQISMDNGGNGHRNAAGFQMSRAEFELHYPTVLASLTEEEEAATA